MSNNGIAYSFANSEDGKRIHIENAERGKVYTCPCCGGQMIPNLGTIKRHYFSHKSKAACDKWYGNKGEWHLSMQEIFDKEEREVVVSVGGEKHIADICKEKPCGQKLVIEFQKSHITKEEFLERTYFWKVKVGADIIWVFDYSQDKRMKGKKNRFQRIPETENAANYTPISYRWNEPAAPFSDLSLLKDVPIFFYMNAEEKCEYDSYSICESKTLYGLFRQDKFFFFVQDMGKARKRLSGGEITGIRLDTFPNYIVDERYNKFISPRMPECEVVTITAKNLFQCNYMVKMCRDYCSNKPNDKKTLDVDMYIVNADTGYYVASRTNLSSVRKDFVFFTGDDGVSKEDIMFIESILGEGSVKVDSILNKQDLRECNVEEKPAEVLPYQPRKKLGGIVIDVNKDKYNEYTRAYIDKKAEYWLLTTAIIKETGVAEYMYIPISRDEFLGIKNNTVDREDVARKHFPEDDVHCPELIIAGFNKLPNWIDEVKLLTQYDGIPEKGHEVILSEKCFIPNERHVKMRVSEIPVPFNEECFPIITGKVFQHSLHDGAEAKINYQKDVYDYEYIGRCFYQKSNAPNVVA